MKIENETQALDAKLSRRQLLGHAARAAVAVPGAMAIGTLAACGDSGGQSTAKAPAPPAAPKAPAPKAAAAPKPAPAAPPAAAPAGGEALITEIPANQAMVTSLKYVNETPEAEKRCGNCQLYTAGEGGSGKCVLFPNGLVAENGWCQSWVAKLG